MADLLGRIASLSPEQRARLESRVANLGGAADPPYERIPPRDPARPIPLGVAQQREWAIARLHGVNNVASALRVEGAVDRARLDRALSELLRRHDVLRSTIEVGADGVPVQLVHPAVAVPVSVVDLAGFGAAEQEQEHELRRVYTEEVFRPFAPDDVVRIRAFLLRLAPEVHILMLVTDHAASDAWSMGVLLRQIATLYALDRADTLPPPGLQFADFAAWQHEQLDEERRAAEVRHWQATLSGAPPTIALPTDRPPAHPVSHQGAVLAVELPDELYAAVRRFGERAQATLVPILLAASAVLLHRHLEQTDLVIGSVVSGRSRRETEELVGAFANPLPLRVQVSPDQTLGALVEQARQAMTTALDHQDVPFDRLVDALGLSRDTAQTSLSRMWINVVSVPTRVVELPGLRFARAPIDLGIVSVDLTLSALPEGEHLRLRWEYMTDLFDAGTIQMLSEQFEAVLRQLVTTPDLGIDDVELD